MKTKKPRKRSSKKKDKADKSVSLDMTFEEAMHRIVRVKPQTKHK